MNKTLAESTRIHGYKKKEWGSDKKHYVIFEWPLSSFFDSHINSLINTSSTHENFSVKGVNFSHNLQSTIKWPENRGIFQHMSKFQTNKIEIKKSGSTMTSAISQLVYIPNFRAIGQSVWEKNGNTQKHRKTETQTDRQTDLNFIKIDKTAIYHFTIDILGELIFALKC